jgi:hypothetical protein
MKIKIKEDQQTWNIVDVDVDDFDREDLLFVGYNAAKKMHPELTPDNHCAKIEINREVDEKLINVVEIYDTNGDPMMSFEYEIIE